MKGVDSLTLRTVPVVFVAGVMLAFASRVLIPAVFGSAHACAMMPAAVMLLVVPFLWQVRAIEPARHAHDRPDINTKIGSVRVAILAGGGIFLPRLTGEALVGIAAALTTANVVAGAWSVIALRTPADAEVLQSPAAER